MHVVQGMGHAAAETAAPGRAWLAVPAGLSPAGIRTRLALAWQPCSQVCTYLHDEHPNAALPWSAFLFLQIEDSLAKLERQIKRRQADTGVITPDLEHEVDKLEKKVIKLEIGHKTAVGLVRRLGA